MVKQQIPHPLRSSLENIASSSTKQEMTALSEAIDALQCVVCKGEVKSPRMMKCRHAFCLQCFKNRLVISYKKDDNSICPVCNVAVITNRADKKEGNALKSAVSFAPLPPKMRDGKCRTCGETCENKCKHCKRRFCDVCWSSHINDLKEELGNINGDLETSAMKFEDKISNFRDKVNETKEFINKDIEAKIIELDKKRESRIKKIEHIIAIGEISMDDIRQRMYKAQMEIKEQKEVSYDVLPDNEGKRRTCLVQKASQY